VRLSPLGTAAIIGLLYQPRVIDDDESGAIGGINIGRWYRSTRRKPSPVPLCPPQIPHDPTRARTRAAAVGRQRLTSWAMARPPLITNTLCTYINLVLETEREVLLENQTANVILPHSKIKQTGISNILGGTILYGWETWSLTLRKEHRVSVFKNRVLRRIFGPKRN
jgi:hypothetical protein